LTGSTISHYEILERLGAGSLGSVFKARDLDLERIVALRVLPAELFAGADERERVLRDLATAGTLDHPNVCPVWDVEERDGGVLVSLALCEGETLADRLARAPLRPATVASLGTQIAAGLARAHAAGLAHGLLHAGNVLLTTDGQAKVLDLGLAALRPPASLGEGGRGDLKALGELLRDMLPADAPEELRQVVMRAQSAHFSGAEELRQALRALRSSGTRPSVVPFTDQPTVREIPTSAFLGGSRLPPEVGPYRLREQLGGGGMGIIYKAEDVRLGRTVALKFLPPELTRDPVAKARFSQEARAASALDHPNICTIYDVGETPDAALFLSMPCYEGETLRDRLEQGTLPLEQAADVARQVAQGLAKAHRQGIVHRDIKPANLMLTSDGVVKILDFGIAKLAGGVGITRTGVAVGTPAYMAPEQIKGEEVDLRADLWSLGVVLYEMLAGRRPFPDENDVLAFHAVLTQDPAPLRSHRPDVPPELEQVVAGLLQKDPAERTPTAEALLEELFPITGGTGIATMRSLRSLPVVVARRRRERLSWIAVGLGAVALALLAWWIARRPPAPAGPPTFTRLTDQEGIETFPSLDPNGEFFLFTKVTPDGSDVYLQRIGGGNPINLTPNSPAEDSQPAYSPDGSRIAFESQRDGGGIYLMGATGESVRRLTDFGYDPAWAPGGRELAVATLPGADPRGRTGRSQLWRVDAGTGRKTLATPGDAVQPSWSPHGWRIAYWGLPANSSQRVIWTVSTESAAPADPVPAIQDEFVDWSPVWSPDGRYLYFASDRGGSMNLWRVRIDERSGEVGGKPEPVTTPAEWSGHLAMGPDGRRIAYTAQEFKSNIESAAFDPVALAVTGPVRSLTQGSRSVTYGKVAPDGSWIVFRTLAPQEDLFVIRSDGSDHRQITQDAFHDRGPVWLPDGRILFFSDRGGRFGIWSIRPDGSDLLPLVRPAGGALYQPVPSPDGRRLVCNLDFRTAVLVDLDKPLEQRVPRPLPIHDRETRPFFASSWSRDGRWLAGGIDGRGAAIYSLATGTYEAVLEGGVKPVWLPDSRTILYLREGKILAYDMRSRATRVVLEPPGGSAFTGVDVSSDGRTLYLLRDAEEADVWLLTMPEDGA
jgi:serine/threonine protein kinase/Tol biopolymer transport system component